MIRKHGLSALVLLLVGTLAVLALNWKILGTLASSEGSRTQPAPANLHIQPGLSDNGPGSVTPASAGVCGDQNEDGQVTIQDVMIDLQIITGLIEATEEQVRLSDVVPDSEINIFDAILTLQHIVDLNQITTCGGPFVSEPVTPDETDIDLSELPTVDPWKPGDPIIELPRPEEEFDSPQSGSGLEQSAVTGEPEVPGAISPSSATSDTIVGLLEPIVSFDGIPGTGVAPPDTVGDIGPNHYIQMVNTAFAIYDRQGTLLAGPSLINSLWSGFGGLCETQNMGDPIVQYDHLADRWLVSQFAFDVNASGPVPPFLECIAISRTGDPVSGGWFLYGFTTPAFPDYPKFGVWPDAYYMSTFEGANLGVFAFDRASMLNGDPATFVRFTIPSLSAGRPQTRILPSDLDGPTLPPAGSPNFFVRSVDGAIQGGGDDRLEIFEFHVDFDSPTASAFTGPTSLTTDPYDIQMCGPTLPRACIFQPGTTQRVDPLSNRLMRPLQYRNFGTHETLVASQTVDVGDFDDHAGVRWYELRRVGGAWSIRQQGAHAPDPRHRWMGSAAMDKDGNMALGYSVVSGDIDVPVSPGIRYVGRLASDPLGTTPQGEVTLVAGGGSQTGSVRWGDYSSMNIDPLDDCTFWFTTKYYATNSAVGWRTRIATFGFPGCQGIGSILAAQGKVTFLRVHDVGTGFGPPTDFINVEVVVQLAGQPGSFGFQLRDDDDEAARRGMLDLLRDAFNDDRTVRIDYVRTGLNNGIILRVAEIP